MEKNTRNIQQAVVVGGGLIGIEMVEMLLSRGIQTTFLVREHSFWNAVLPAEESDLINRHIRTHLLDLRLDTELKQIEGTDQVQAIHTQRGERLPCQFVGITIGVRPNIGCIDPKVIAIDRGILVDNNLMTSQPDIYAIGDCAQLRNPLAHRRAIEPVWYVGRMMGETLAHTLLGNPRAYRPGVWFNSAKFFDIEYQVYGFVPTASSEKIDSLYWENPNENQAMRIVFDKTTQQVLGCNVLGMRQRHPQWIQWIEQQEPLESVLENLEQARFDAEFAYAYEPHIRLAHRVNNTY